MVATTKSTKTPSESIRMSKNCDEQQEDHTWEYKTGNYIEIEGGGELTTFLRCIDCGRILCIWRRISHNEIDNNLASE